MYLDKFPVTTKRDEYRVILKERRDSLFGKFLHAEVYLRLPSRFTKKSKWKKVSGYAPLHKEGWWKDEFYRGRYVELAKVAVKDYEDWLIEQEEKSRSHEQGIKDWKSWDGDMR
ncbi:hypothetical protein JOC34_000602 [Virgibacillus halotolerans]|uniref:hypothetical protein n=1 Tax=Virgibacillus halotolerans TaxID=1071053 RepID=UPI00196079ED|nr:hypothetical protein [Virgibacillus halotolerans]MBM7598245.1 hypothetical protein [Virgibacillus halotolerans]